MKTKVLCGCILSIFILMMLPSVQAVENNTLQEITEKIKNIEIQNDELKLKIIEELEKAENISPENQEKIEKINNLLGKIDFTSEDIGFLRYALIFFLFGLYFNSMGYESLAKLYMRLSIIYLILYLLYM
ncbi:MAG: hypothetical protein KAW45_04700 [Thermoplasmatales archaeon]|nr:hypothetical protein [Thermoplasmatales archaeon]